MKEWLKENKLYVFGGTLLLVVMIYYYWFARPSIPLPVTEPNIQEATSGNIVEQQPEQQDTPKIIMIDIKGAVVKPGVYEATEGERVHDLIERAGGLSEGADSTKINFAMYVKDEMILYIPAVGEIVEGLSEPGSASTGQVDNGKVNLNTADATELETLPGIGPSKAAAIIEYRETSGPFKSIEDLQSISGIGTKTFEKLKEKITID
ncbi:helix-hairpin-helix domain-containing protein [Bacillus marasmi]|uniref:helix-hairpin-helix domain-containing protein n=1 Tax=Bacillus marasmi TaxID=1926279 RepID=UPI001FE9D4CF|nr:helix-hairpin-helix domain-containing protein [Bacillus marasmi]